MLKAFHGFAVEGFFNPATFLAGYSFDLLGPSDFEPELLEPSELLELLELPELLEPSDLLELSDELALLVLSDLLSLEEPLSLLSLFVERFKPEADL